MSLILEALRKSEAERQRGRAPGLFVEQDLVRPRARRAALWPWALGAALAVVLLAWGWREWARAESPASADVAVAPATPSPATDAGPPPAAGVAGMTAGAGRAPAAAPIPQPVDPVTVPDPAPAPRPRLMDTAVPQVANVADPVAPDRSIRARPAQVALPPQPEPPPQPLPQASPPVPPPPAVASEEVLPTLASLAAAERTALPPLKLTMHVFADEPAKRFVILDGRRLAEGASPAPGLVIEQIRRDGLVLSVNGQRVLLARP